MGILFTGERENLTDRLSVLSVECLSVFAAEFFEHTDVRGTRLVFNGR
jgi:hypothetical protein